MCIYIYIYIYINTHTYTHIIQSKPVFNKYQKKKKKLKLNNFILSNSNTVLHSHP